MEPKAYVPAEGNATGPRAILALVDTVHEGSACSGVRARDRAVIPVVVSCGGGGGGGVVSGLWLVSDGLVIKVINDNGDDINSSANANMRISVLNNNFVWMKKQKIGWKQNMYFFCLQKKTEATRT
jgi:hypothetical protein